MKLIIDTYEIKKSLELLGYTNKKEPKSSSKSSLHPQSINHSVLVAKVRM